MKKTATFLFCSAILFYTNAQLSVVKPNVYAYDFITELNGSLLFFAADPSEPSNYELWISDGTDAGTSMLKDINGTADGSILSNTLWLAQYRDRMPVEFNNELYFLANDGPHGMEIWKTDGTEPGTVMLKDIHPGTGGYFDPEFNYPYFTEMNGELFFAANNGTHGFELWKTDGTDAGTEMVKDISADGVYGSNPEHLINFNGTLIFTARDDDYGYEIYKSDGIADGTELIKDIVPGIYGSMNNGYASSIDPQFTVSGDYLYFTGRIDEILPIYYYLYRTDGSAAGTITLNNDLQNVTNCTDIAGTCYFYAFDGDYDHSSLWKSNGTPAGTELITTENIMASSTANSFYNFNDQLYFYGYQSDFSAFGLAKSDGTTGGTDMITAFEGLGSVPEVYNFNRDEGSPWFFYHALKKISESAMSIRMVQTIGTTAGTIVYPGVQPFRTTAFLGGDIYFPGIDSTADEVWGIYKIHPMEIISEISTINPEHEFSIYPNPVSGIASIPIPPDLSDAKLEVFNVHGEVVYMSLIAESESFASFDTFAFKNGIYFIRLSSDNIVYSNKLLVLN